MKRNRLIIPAAVLVAIFGSLLFVFQVRQSEMAVVTTFGSVTRPVTQPGLNFKLPWPIQSVYHLDQRVQNFESSFEEAKLPDQYTLLMQVYVGWRIEKPDLFFPKFNKGSVSAAKDALENLVRTAKNEVVGQHPFEDFISADEKAMKLAQIEDEILKRVRDQVKAQGSGIEVKFVQIKKLGLPDSVTESVFTRMQSEREVKISKIRFEGEEAATKIKSQADRDASKTLADADAKARQIRGEGEAEAMKSLAVLQQNPELAVFNMKLEALEQLLKEKTTLILDQGTPPLDLLSEKHSLNVEASKK